MMNRLITLITAFGFVILIASCATTSHPNQKMIIGNWSAQKVNAYIDPNAPPTPAVTAANSSEKLKVATQDTGKMAVRVKRGEKAQNLTPEEIAQYKAQKFQQVLRMEEKSMLKINADKTAEKIYPGKVIKGKWKMKKDGKRLIAKTKEKGRMLFDILNLNDSVAVVVEHFPVGDVQVKYVKIVKK